MTKRDTPQQALVRTKISSRRLGSFGELAIKLGVTGQQLFEALKPEQTDPTKTAPLIQLQLFSILVNFLDLAMDEADIFKEGLTGKYIPLSSEELYRLPGNASLSSRWRFDATGLHSAT